MTNSLGKELAVASVCSSL